MQIYTDEKILYFWLLTSLPILLFHTLHLILALYFAGPNKREPKVILALHHKCLRHNRRCFYGIVFVSQPTFVSFSVEFLHEKVIFLLVGFQVAGILDSIFQNTVRMVKKIELGKNI